MERKWKNKHNSSWWQLKVLEIAGTLKTKRSVLYIYAYSIRSVIKPKIFSSMCNNGQNITPIFQAEDQLAVDPSIRVDFSYWTKNSTVLFFQDHARCHQSIWHNFFRIYFDLRFYKTKLIIFLPHCWPF